MEISKNKCRFLLDDGQQCQNDTTDGKQFCHLHTDISENDMEIYKVATTHFRQDLTLFWTRANFFLIVQAGLISVAAGNITSQSSFSQNNKVVSLLLCGVGFLVALFWFWVMRGTIFWIKEWRKEVIKLDKAVSRFQSYARIETMLIKNPIYSPSIVTQYLPIIFIVGWIFLGIMAFKM